MRRHVNTRVLLWTMVAAIVLAVAGAFVHDWQFSRNIDVLMRRAQQALKQEQLDQAALYLQQYLAYHPADNAALIQYGKTLHKLADSPSGQYRALLVLQQAVRRVPKDLDLRKEAALLALELAYFAEAADNLRVLLASFPNDAQLWQELGWCQEGQNQFAQAEISYRKSIDLDAHSLLSYARLANLFLRVHRSSEVVPVLDLMIAANPSSWEALLARADYLQSIGGMEQAARDIDKAYKAAAKEPLVILAKATLEEKQNHLDQARAILKQGLAQHPANEKLFKSLVQLELKSGQPAQALHWLEQQLKQRPQDLQLRFQLFDLALEHGDRKLAEKVLVDLKKTEGDKGPFWRYAEAALLLTFGGPKDAAQMELARQRLAEAKQLQPAWNQPVLLEGLLEELTGNKAHAIKLYQQAVKLGQVTPPFLFRLANLLNQDQQYLAAAAALAKIEAQVALSSAQAKLGAEIALKLGEGHRAAVLARQAVPTDSRDYREHLWQAKMLALAGQGGEAETVLRNLVKTSPSIPEVWVALVQRLADTGKQTQAVEVMAQVGQKIPAVKLKLTLGRCHEALGNLNQAEKLFVDNVEFQPYAYMGWKYLAEFYLRQEQYAKAEPWLRQLVDSPTGLPPELAKAARRQLAIALAHQNDMAKYKEALTLVPPAKTPEDSVARAIVLSVKADERPQAIALLVQAQKQQPLLPEQALTLAKLYRLENQPAKACAILEGLLTFEGERPDYLAEYVRCLAAQHNVGAAEVQLKRLQQLQPNYPQLPELHLLIKKL